MAVVYEAAHARIDRRFAVKILQIDPDYHDEALIRFEREARIGSQLGHPHIVEVVDFNRTPAGEPYLVMELLQGCQLRQVLGHHERAPLDWSIAVLRQVGSALTAAHDHGVIHRDLKPENILLCGEHRRRVQAKVMDFGISKVLSSKSFVTQGSTMFGTPWYMAPEQAEGRRDAISARTDLYALGVMLYELVSGRTPFDGPSIPTVLYKVVHGDPEPLAALRPDLPPGFSDVVARAMSKHPEERYGSAAEMVGELEQVLGRGWGRVLAWGQAPEDRIVPVLWDKTLMVTGLGQPPIDSGGGDTAGPEPVRRQITLFAAAVVAVGVVAGITGGVLLLRPGRRRSDGRPSSGARQDGAVVAQALDAPAPGLDAATAADSGPDAAAAPDSGRSTPDARPRPRPTTPGTLRVTAKRKTGKLVTVALYLNGRRLGETPLNKGVKPGSYRLEARQGGVTRQAQRIWVRSGATTTVVFRLE